MTNKHFNEMTSTKKEKKLCLEHYIWRVSRLLFGDMTDKFVYDTPGRCQFPALENRTKE